VAVEVEVAVLGDPAKAFSSAAVDDSHFATPWNHRLRTSIRAEDDESLAGVLRRAAASLGIAPVAGGEIETVAWVAFYSDHESLGWNSLKHSLTLVDPEGRAHWSVWDYDQIPYSEIIRAGQAGVLPGDPRRPYLVLLPPSGNGVLPSWAELLLALKITWDLMQAMDTVGGARAFAQEVIREARERLDGGRERLEQHFPTWEERGARPENFSETLKLGPWHSDDLAERLECTPQEAEAILWAYGYTKAESGLWRRGGDDAAAVLNPLAEDLARGRGYAHERSYSNVVRERVQIYLDTGQFPPEPEPELHDEDPDYDPDAPVDIELDESFHVDCGCGNPGCTVVATFYRTVMPGGQSRFKLVFSQETDHFAIDTMSLGTLLGFMAR
jgi:hypothetical protein